MAKVAQRLRLALERNGMRQSELAEATGIGKSSISTYLSGEYEPKQKNIYKMASILGVSAAWLMGLDVPMDWQENIPPGLTAPPEMKRVPLLGTIACGQPILAEENLDGYTTVPAEVSADFALRCKGDSMINARILDGDLVFIRQQETVENGEIAAVLVENEATLKRVYKSGEQLILQPENPRYAPLVYSGEPLAAVRILGRAVAFMSMVR